MKNKMLFLILIAILFLTITACQKDNARQETADKVSTEPIDNNEDNIGNEDEELNSRAIAGSLIRNHPILEDNSFVEVSMGDICNGNIADFKESYSEKKENGYLHFFWGEGIIYVCGEPSGHMENKYKDILGIILTKKDKYELACGVKVGMKEKELRGSTLRFQEITKEIVRDEIPVEEPDYSYAYEKAISGLFDFDKIYYAKRELTMEEWREYQCRDIDLAVFVKDGEVIAVSEDNSGDSFYEFSITDILIKDHPVFCDRMWWWATWKEIEEKCPENFDVLYSEDGANGHFTYKIGDGITYINGMWGGDICAIMLTSGKYSFDCGLKVGMTEEELRHIDLPFKKYNMKEFGVNESSTVLSRRIEPISLDDYDCFYYFDQGFTNNREAKELLIAAGIPTDGFSSAGRVGLTVLLENGIVKIICTEIPV